MVHQKDARGNFLKVEMMHVGQAQCSSSNTVSQVENDRNGLTSGILGTVFGLQHN